MGGIGYGAVPEVDENPFKEYKRKGDSSMRKYVLDEDLSKISVSDVDDPKTDLGYIARNPANWEDKWYVAKEYAVANFDL